MVSQAALIVVAVAVPWITIVFDAICHPYTWISVKMRSYSGFLVVLMPRELLEDRKR